MSFTNSLWWLRSLSRPYVIGCKNVNMKVKQLDSSGSNRQLTLYRNYSSGEFVSKFKSMFGVGPLSKNVTRVKGILLYQTIAEGVDYEQFINGMNLPDTFHSWFLVTELHVWMLMVRMMNEGQEGRMIRNGIVAALWEDVEQRSKQLGDISSGIRKKQINLLVQEFQAALFSYDEGLQSSDQVLAGAIWRKFFSNTKFDIGNLQVLVEYVRKHIHQLDSLNKEEVIGRKFQWSALS